MFGNSVLSLPVPAGKVFIGLFAVLAAASLVGRLAERGRSWEAAGNIRSFNAKVASWWGMAVLMLVMMYLGRGGMVALFAAISFLALREFVTQVYRRRADHYAVALCFYAILPLQYYFVAIGWYSMVAVFIPVYVFLLLPVAGCLSGDMSHFFERTAEIQWAVMVTVYCLSHVPALMDLDIRGYEGQNVLLLLFMLLVMQGGGAAAYLWRQFVRRGSGWHGEAVCACIRAVSSAMLAAGLFWITPFTPFQAALCGLLVSLTGSAGSGVPSAIKHNFGIRNWLPDHPQRSMLDGAAGICFAAPVFFHVVRYYWG